MGAATKIEWVRGIMKQLGDRRNKGGRLECIPVDLRIREYPGDGIHA